MLDLPAERAALHAHVAHQNGFAAPTPWSRRSLEVAEDLGVNPELGLSTPEAEHRRREVGANVLQHRKPRSAWSILASQFKSVIVLLLIVAAGVAFFFGEIAEGWAIAVVILINASLGFVTELRAVRSMDALHALARVTARVRRDGKVREIEAKDLVPGDIVLVEGGDVVAADMRILSASRLQSNESTLTGESLPVGKTEDPADAQTALADRSSMLFKGTSITRGSGSAVVAATGGQTELGRISNLVAQAGDERTPLEERLDQLGRKFIWITLGIAVLVTVLGVLRGKDLFLMIETGIALAVASIPEGLPIVATIALARGVRLMAKHNALINRLASVETLGSAGVICTDKTGTLTENQMRVIYLALKDQVDRVDEYGPHGIRADFHGHRAKRPAIEIGILCNNAEVTDDDELLGDPIETALLELGRNVGLSLDDLLDRFPRVAEEAFDSVVKMMATVHESDHGYRYAVKGAPEAVLSVCSQVYTLSGSEPIDVEAWLATNDSLADDGLRMLALAEKYVDRADDETYRDLTLAALVAMADPPRSDVRDAIDLCRKAGIQVIMVTGDQPRTAVSVARAVGLVDDHSNDVITGPDFPNLDDLNPEERDRLLAVPVFARLDPSQKLDLIDLHQEAGRIVAMTGDGVNDAPALQKADIGIAMGLRGTQVAREAADMVLRDDAFSSIVAAVEQGRVIFANIRRFVFYLLSCNVSEVLVVGVAALVGGPLPIFPLQILFLNLVTDIFPALALGMGAGDPRAMQRPPRNPEEPVLKRRHWYAIAFYGGLITASVLLSLFTARYLLAYPTEQSVTISFLTLAFAQLWHVFNMRARGSAMFKNDVVSNPYVWMAIVLCASLLLSATYIPLLADVLRVHPPDILGWTLVAGYSLIPTVVGQILLSYRRCSENTRRKPCTVSKQRKALSL